MLGKPGVAGGTGNANAFNATRDGAENTGLLYEGAVPECVTVIGEILGAVILGEAGAIGADGNVRAF
jgi:hypothetical protein